MTFWAPYTEDGVLDLSKRSISIKTEPLSPREACSAEAPSGYPATCDLRGSSSASPQHYPDPFPTDYIQNQYAAEHPLVPAIRFSPDSSSNQPFYPERTPSQMSPISVGAASLSPVWSGKSSPDAKSKVPRPFKAVTRAFEADCGQMEGGDGRYANFREAMLAAVRARNGGSLCVSNPRMRRAVRRSQSQQQDDDYLQRRARNNAAAKKSRDLRRLKEDELAIRTAYLEAENQRLRLELDAVQRQLSAFQGVPIVK